MFNICYVVMFADDTSQIVNSDVSNECMKKDMTLGRKKGLGTVRN